MEPQLAVLAGENRCRTMTMIKQSSSETEAYTGLITNIMIRVLRKPSSAECHEKKRKVGL